MTEISLSMEKTIWHTVAYSEVYLMSPEKISKNHFFKSR